MPAGRPSAAGWPQPLARIEGEYGYCEDCGEDIAFGRLELDPAAALRVQCARG